MASSSINQKVSNPAPITFSWMGVAGLLFRAGGKVLAIDPFFTRPSIFHLLFKRLDPDIQRIEAAIPRCDAILVSHAHHDHLMDVSTVIAATGAQVYAPSNACKLLSVMGVEEAKIHPIRQGDLLTLGPFQVTVAEGTHIKLPLPISGKLPRRINQPPRFTDYKLDVVFSYFIEVEGFSIAIAPAQPVQSDLLFPYINQPGMIEKILNHYPPRAVVLIHWDNLFRPLKDPPQLSGWIPRMNILCFSRWLKKKYPGINLLIPEYFHTYDIRKILMDKVYECEVY
jgi:L-ascorbate metabolism protein UlaG (beta-lactamase superfamily)